MTMIQTHTHTAFQPGAFLYINGFSQFSVNYATLTCNVPYNVRDVPQYNTIQAVLFSNTKISHYKHRHCWLLADHNVSLKL